MVGHTSANIHYFLPTAGWLKLHTPTAEVNETAVFPVRSTFVCLENQLVNQLVSQLVLFCLVSYPFWYARLAPLISQSTNLDCATGRVTINRTQQQAGLLLLKIRQHTRYIACVTTRLHSVDAEHKRTRLYEESQHICIIILINSGYMFDLEHDRGQGRTQCIQGRGSGLTRICQNRIADHRGRVGQPQRAQESQHVILKSC